MTQKKQNLSKRFYTVAIVLVVLLGTIGVATNVVSRQYILQDLKNDYAQQQSEVAKQTADQLKQNVAIVIQKLEYIAQIPSIQSLDSQTCNQAIDQIMTQFGNSLGNLGRTGPDDVFYCSHNRQIIGAKGEAFGSYLPGIFKDPLHKPVISRMVLPTGSDAYVLAVHVPVYSNGQFVGTLGGAISAKLLATELLNGVKIGQTGTVSVIDDNGDIIYSHDTKNIGKNRNDPTLRKLNGSTAELDKAFNDAKAGHSSSITYTRQGEKRYAFVTSAEVLPGRHWVVYGIVPQSEIDNDAAAINASQVITARTLVVGGVMLITIVIFALMLRTRVFKPLKQMSHAIASIQTGDRSVRLRFRRNDEFGQLGRSFNSMLDELANYNSDLEKEIASKTHQLRLALNESEKRTQQLQKAQRDREMVMDELKSAKELSQTESIKNQAVVSSLGDGLVVTDEYGHITFINPVAEDFLGTSNEEAKDQWYQDVLKLYDKNGKNVEAEDRPLYQAIASAKTTSNRNYWMEGKGGIKVPVELTVSPFIVGGKPAGAIELINDITAERALDEAKDDFLALVSHQLQTPATAVKQFLGLILEGYMGDTNKEQKEIIQKAYQNNEDQITIIQDLLEVARLESGRSVLSIKPINAKEFIDGIVTAQQITLDKRGQKVSVKVPANLKFDGDEVKLKMCITNFMTNAIKYTPEEGQVFVEVASPAGKYYTISVSDTGMGMTKSQQAKLFRRFSRVHGKSTANIPGTGLGLFLCKQIALLHGGNIKVTSAPGKGSTFTLQLPKLIKQPKTDEEKAQEE